MEDLLQYEKELYEQNIQFVAGVDEVGRGPLLGPVVAACVVLPKHYHLDGLNDSKKLSEKKREALYEIILKDALGVGIGIVDEKEIDEINIYQASKKAMLLAIENTKCRIEHVLVDAMPIETSFPFTPIIKGDAKSLTIAAASVVAKVKRDHMMYELDEQYPEYEFRKHKGYPTKRHLELLKKHGVLACYRKTYRPVKELLEGEFV